MKEYKVEDFTWEANRNRKDSAVEALFQIYCRDEKSFDALTKRVSARKAKHYIEKNNVMKLMMDEFKVKKLGEYHIKLLKYRISRNGDDNSSRFTTVCYWGVCNTKKNGKSVEHTCKHIVTRTYSDDILEIMQDVTEDMYDTIRCQVDADIVNLKNNK